MRLRRRGESQRGVSLTELLFVVAGTGFVLVALTRFVFGNQQSILRNSNHRDMLAMNIRMGKNIRASLAPSSTLIAGYGGVHDFSDIYSRINAGIAAGAAQGVPQKVAFSALPVAKDGMPAMGGSASADAPYWGNELCFVAVVGPVTFTAIVLRPCVSCSAQSTPVTTPNAGYTPVANSTPNASHLAENYNVERYQFVLIYLTMDTKRPVRNMPGRLRVVEWRSKPYASYDSLALSSGPQLLTSTRILTERGYDHALKVSELEDPETAFYKMNTSGTYLDNSVAAPATIPTQSWSYLEDYELVHEFNPSPLKPKGRISQYGASVSWAGGMSVYGVAFNNLFPTANPTTKVNRLHGTGHGDLSVPQYAELDRGGIGFPGGFEVGIFGRSGSRQIYIRRTLMASSGSDPRGGPKDFLAHDYMDYMTVNSDY